MKTIYLDNAATSFPKPEGVSDAMKNYIDQVGATINRSVYGSAQDAGLVTLQLWERLKRLFRFPEPVTHVILTRCGLHCAPSAHKTLDTFPRGTVRFFLGFASTESDIDAALAAIRKISEA